MGNSYVSNEEAGLANLFICYFYFYHFFFCFYFYRVHSWRSLSVELSQEAVARHSNVISFTQECWKSRPGGNIFLFLTTALLLSHFCRWFDFGGGGGWRISIQWTFHFHEGSLKKKHCNIETMPWTKHTCRLLSLYMWSGTGCIVDFRSSCPHGKEGKVHIQIIMGSPALHFLLWHHP